MLIKGGGCKDWEQMCRASGALMFFLSLPSAYPPQHAKTGRAEDPVALG